MNKAAQWETAAIRERTVSKAFNKAVKSVDLYLETIMQFELDTGVTLFPTEAAAKKYIKGVPKANRLDVLAEYISKQFEGLDVPTVKKMLEFRSFSHLRWPRYAPYVLPKDTQIIIVWGDRTHFYGTGDKGHYSSKYGADRYVAGGVQQIDEVIVPMPAKCPPDNPCAKFGGMAKAFEIHFRFMHTESVFEEVKKHAFDKIGMF